MARITVVNDEVRCELSLLLLQVLPVILSVHLVLDRPKFHYSFLQFVEGPVVNVHAVIYSLTQGLHFFDSMKKANALVS